MPSGDGKADGALADGGAQLRARYLANLWARLCVRLKVHAGNEAATAAAFKLHLDANTMRLALIWHEQPAVTIGFNPAGLPTVRAGLDRSETGTSASAG